MKKTVLLILILLMLCGCSHNDDNRQDDETRSVYYESIKEVDPKTLASSSVNFAITAVVAKSIDKYHYVITISEPKVAMIDIRAMAIIGSYDIEAYTIDDAASYGLKDDEIKSMIPNQVNKTNNFVDSISLEFRTKNNEEAFTVLIEWKNKDGNQTKREYISLLVKCEEE